MKHYGFIVIGGGPAGHRAAVEAACAGQSTLLIERGPRVGGECVFRGTVPSKTLLASARGLREMRRASLDVPQVGERSPVPQLMDRVRAVSDGYSRSISKELKAAGVTVMQARARFLGPREIQAERMDGSSQRFSADHVLIATGTRPRVPCGIPMDHERVLDSDSILSLAYLPKSLLVVGAGVIGSEFASLFQALGVEVTMVDSHALPMGFLEPEIAGGFLAAFESEGGRFEPNVRVESMTLCASEGVDTVLSSGETLHAAKVLVAQGRVAGLQGLGLESAGLAANQRGLLDVDEFGCTAVPGIYAAGDVSGPPALAAASMHQGQRAVRHALGLDPGLPADRIPSGIYTLPELSSVGLTEAQAIEQHGGATVGTCDFSDLARARIDGATEGMLRMVCDASGERILGVHIIADRASELIHMGQMALLAEQGPRFFADTIFNFPTYAQAYSAAARDALALVRTGGARSDRAA